MKYNFLSFFDPVLMTTVGLSTPYKYAVFKQLTSH